VANEPFPPKNFTTLNDSVSEKAADPAEIKKRSVILDGHRTSVSLENAFWTDLKKIAALRNTTVNQLVTEIDRDRTGNLSSAIRMFILEQYRQQTTLR
jgi:predicted DNA-binding ribbon-helix-helix protein